MSSILKNNVQSTNQLINGRDSSIDVAKGIGIFLVVWGHQFANCPIHDWIILFHMPLFFIIGGCFIKDEAYKVFLYKKMRTLLIPFIVFYLFSFIVKTGLYYIRSHSFDFLFDLHFYSTKTINYVLWFIMCLFIAINIYYFVRKMGRFKLPMILFLVTISAFLFYYQISLPLWTSQAMMVVGFLYLGETYYKRGTSDKLLLVLFLLTAPLWWYVGAQHFKTDMGGLTIPANFLYFIIPALSGTALTLLLGRLISLYRWAGIFRMMGTYSLFIFGFHVNTGFLDGICHLTLSFTPPVR